MKVDIKRQGEWGKVYPAQVFHDSLRDFGEKTCQKLFENHDLSARFSFTTCLVIPSENSYL